MPDAPRALYLTMAATPENVAVLRQRLRSFLHESIDDDGVVDDLAMATSEALENVADHAYHRDGPAGSFRMAACFASPCCDRRTVVVNVSDDGTWQVPGAPGYRGRGLQMIGQLVASHTIATGGDGTSITMVHSFPTVRPA